jgi:PadR family transcriptional regulator AphA
LDAVCGRYVAAVAKALPELSLSDCELRADGSLGRVWTVARAVVYRSLFTLTSHGLIEECGEAPGARGSQRTIVRATRSGRAALRQWLDTPVEHVRDVRTELLLKLAILARAGGSSQKLIERQLAELTPVIRAVSADPIGDGFDVVLARWRREQTRAVERFLRALARHHIATSR